MEGGAWGEGRREEGVVVGVRWGRAEGVVSGGGGWGPTKIM